MSMAKRSRLRKKRIVGNRAMTFADAERWDLEFWRTQSADMRLAALVAIRDDIKEVRETNLARRRREQEG